MVRWKPIRRRIFGLAAVLFSVAVWCQTGAPPTAVASQPLDVAGFFPIRHGDVWTYDYAVQIGRGPTLRVARTRAFDDRELVNAGYVYKLVSQNGDYSLFSVEEGTLRLHGAFEYDRDLRFLFDPPVTLLQRDSQPGKPLITRLPEDDGAGTRVFSAVFEGFESIETPMGKFDHCLKLRWELTSSVARQKTTYYLARGIGVVAYRVEALSHKDTLGEVVVEARLRVMQFEGRDFSKAEALSAAATAPRPVVPAKSDGKAREMFRKAAGRRYVWDGKFSGFEARFTLTREGHAPASGTVRVDSQLDVSVAAADAAVAALAHAEMSLFVVHRKPRPFEQTYAKDRTSFTLGAEDPQLGSEVLVRDEEAMGSQYWIRGNEITRIIRSYGRVRFITDHSAGMTTAEGRDLAVKYRTSYVSNETGKLLSRAEYDDRYERIGGYWLPTGRTKIEYGGDAGAKPKRTELSLVDLRFTSSR